MQPATQPAGSKSTLRQVLAWSPVVIAMLILAQVALLGLRPAVAERRRLAEAQQQMRARVEREEREARELERIERAQNDPIYLERERRALEGATPNSTRDAAHTPPPARDPDASGGDEQQR